GHALPYKLDDVRCREHLSLKIARSYRHRSTQLPLRWRPVPGRPARLIPLAPSVTPLTQAYTTRTFRRSIFLLNPAFTTINEQFSRRVNTNITPVIRTVK